jgi:Fe-S-cluster containining protein
MQFVPWQNIADWRCKSCGYCCKLYSVVINFAEWLNIVKSFGAETTVAGLDKMFIKRCSDGSCSFLCNSPDRYYCGLQKMKPEACKIWPFKVLSEPKYGQPNQAAFDYGKLRLYVYVDTMCSGLRYGDPTWDFRNGTVREFTEIALGIRNIQLKSTRNGTLENNPWARHLRFP